MEGTDNKSPDPNMKIRRGKHQKDRSLKILKTIRTLKHACECRNPTCSRFGCDEMKGMVVHSKVCNRKPKSGCHSCRQLIALCRYHAKRSKDCESVECAVPYCAKIKLLMLKKQVRKQGGVLGQNIALDNNMVPYGLQDAAPRVMGSMTTERADRLPITGELLAERGEGGDGQPSESTMMNLEDQFFPQPQEALPSTSRSLPQSPEVLPSTSRSQTDNQQSTVLEQRREQLRILLHANKCQNRQTQGGVWHCAVSSCAAMKNVLKHILQCTVLTGCAAPHCASSKKIINHWQQCVESDCQFCAPLRHNRNKWQRYNPPQNLTTAVQPRNFATTMQPRSHIATAQPQNLTVSPQPQDLTTTAHPHSLTAAQPQNLTTAQPHGVIAQNVTPPHQAHNRVAITPLQNLQPPENSVPYTVGAVFDLTPSRPNGPAAWTITQNHTSSQRSHTSITNAGPDAAQGVKEWHRSITSVLRKHLVNKIIQTFLSVPEYRFVTPKQRIDRAEQIEDAIFKRANSKSDYYYLIAEKIYTIQRAREVNRTRNENTNAPAHHVPILWNNRDHPRTTTLPENNSTASSSNPRNEDRPLVIQYRPCNLTFSRLTDNNEQLSSIHSRLTLEESQTLSLLCNLPRPREEQW